MKYALPAAIAVLLGLGCTEPQPAQPYYQGTIASIAVVKDVFQNTETTYLYLDDGDPANTCDPSVKVTAQTEIAIGDAVPAVRGTPGDLHAGQTVRIWPPSDPRDTCPMQIEATLVKIMDVGS